MKKIFEFEFEDQSPANKISFEYDDEVDEEVEIRLENGIPVLYANQQGFMALAKIFIKIATCKYKHGFHVHLRKDLDADQPEILRCILM